MPLISVVIPAYNRAHLLPRAISSVQAQDFADLEILIVDDGSTDNTAEVMADLQRHEPRIRYIRHPVNRGEAAARNTGLVEAAGELIAFLDSDDAWLPGKLHRQYDVIAKAGDALDAVLTGYNVIWPDGHEGFEDAWHFYRPITIRNLLVHGCALGLGTNGMMRREAALAAGRFDETLRLYVDVDWLCRFLAKGRMVALPEAYAVYHKAPYRGGRMVEDAGAAFLVKNAPLLRQLSWWDRRRVRAMLWQSAALGYRADGAPRDFARALWNALVCNPFVRLGNYLELFDAVAGTRLVATLRRSGGKPG